MNIQSISIVPETVGCNARCKYCIARMTPPVEKKLKVKLTHLDEALVYAKSGGAQSAIITSKGETLLSDWKFIGEILDLCDEMGFGQRDLHTNARHIEGREKEFKKYFIENEGHLTNITITMASMDPVVNGDIMGINYDIPRVLEFLSRECDITVRLSCVMNESAVRDRRTMEEYIRKASEYGVRAIVFRELWIPVQISDNPLSKAVNKWSRKNRVPIEIGVAGLKAMEKEGFAHPIFTLPWGQVVYDVEGLNVACSQCTGNFPESRPGFIKSVVYLPNNHLYSSWEFRGSIIF